MGISIKNLSKAVRGQPTTNVSPTNPIQQPQTPKLAALTGGYKAPAAPENPFAGYSGQEWVSRPGYMNPYSFSPARTPVKESWWQGATPTAALSKQVAGLGLNARDTSNIAKLLTQYGTSDLGNLKYTTIEDKGYYYDPTSKQFLPEDLGRQQLDRATSVHYTLVQNRDGSVGIKPLTARSAAEGFSLTELLPVLAVAAAPFAAAALGGGTAAGAGAAGGAEAAGAAGSAAGATGLASLPAAGTWAQTALPALGAGAGAWTSPAALAGISGITGAGGLTLGNALSAANAIGDAAGTFGTSAGAPVSSAGAAPTAAGISPTTSPTGLASLPQNAGTWAQTATPTLGNAAGQWTLPEALSGVQGATQAAGGATLADALKAANSATNSTFGTSAGAPAGAGNANYLDQLKNSYDYYSKFNNLQNQLSFNNNPQQGGGGMMNTNIAPLLSSLYQYGQGKDTQGLMQDIAQKALTQGDPFAQYRAGYGQMLQNSYQNPKDVFDKYYSALDDKFYKELRAQDAARGRSTDAYKRGVEREAAFQNWMTQYQNQLGGFAGANINPDNAISNYAALQLMGQNANNQAGQNVVQGLGSLFGGNASGQGGGLSLNSLLDLGRGVYDTGKGAWDLFSGLF